MNYDSWRSTEPEQRYSGGGMGRRVAYKYACDGLVTAVRNACQRSQPEDELFREAQAVWFTRYVIREAKKLGIWSEPVDVTVITRVDVSSNAGVI